MRGRSQVWVPDYVPVFVPDWLALPSAELWEDLAVRRNVPCGSQVVDCEPELHPGARRRWLGVSGAGEAAVSTRSRSRGRQLGAVVVVHGRQLLAVAIASRAPFTGSSSGHRRRVSSIAKMRWLTTP